MANYRNRRVGVEIMREVNEILKRRVRDPCIQEVMITDVQVTGDLSQATIYYSILSNLASEGKAVQAGLKKATGIIKRELGARLKLYKLPELNFERDSSVQYGEKIDELLKNCLQSHNEEHFD
ncbi:MAG: 30S ribosome-binding factor RbfA [Streptococcaceae bacterium]|jgi:ribosome-binding factor A|nr:30S ribosome-binding factor RbfA [Streptococcaceae bacterium]